MLAVLCALCCNAAKKIRTEFGDSTKTHVFTLGAELMTRGEWRHGAMQNEDEKYALFVLERTRLFFNYKQPHLEIQITPQHQGVWGTTGGGSFSLREAWAHVYSRIGLFAKLGRQTLKYDDERVMGLNDWSMTGFYHDALKVGYEGHGHRVHIVAAYNQNNANMFGGTYYTGGSQAYKNMQTLWYHYDFKKWFGASALFINTGMQSSIDGEKKNYYQQLYGAYLKFHYPHNDGTIQRRWLEIEGSYYHQLGRSELNVPVDAWMASVEINGKVNDYVRLNSGYFHLSGDEDYSVPPIGFLGMKQHTHSNSFNPIFASHHQFYGPMEFFYLSSFYGGYSPGLQDFHAGASFTWRDKVTLDTKYHYLATSVSVPNQKNTLGHEIEFTARYRILKYLSVAAGYYYMKGTDTMKTVKRTNDKNSSHWAYLMIVVNPTLLKVHF